MPIESDLLERTMHLSDRDRAELARQLLLSLEGAQSESEVDEAWEAEIERRLAAHDRGETAAIDWEESVERARRTMQGDSGHEG